MYTKEKRNIETPFFNLKLKRLPQSKYDNVVWCRNFCFFLVFQDSSSLYTLDWP